jgi:hypothetical protein
MRAHERELYVTNEPDGSMVVAAVGVSVGFLGALGVLLWVIAG